jgi:hypothetical protein
LLRAAPNRLELVDDRALLLIREWLVGHVTSLGIRQDAELWQPSAGADLPPPSHTGDDIGLLEHPAPNLEPGDVVVLADGRDALVTARVEAERGSPLAALLKVVVAPPRSLSAG